MSKQHPITDAPPASKTESPADRFNAPVNRELEEEQHLWSGSFSGKSMFGSWIAAAVISLALILAITLIEPLRDNTNSWYVGIGLIVVGWLWLVSIWLYRKLGMHYEVSDQRLRHREGILFRKIDRIEMIDIDDVNYQQGPIQAMLDVGNISIKSSDRSHPELTMYGIHKVREIADMIDDARRAERRKRGLHIESV